MSLKVRLCILVDLLCGLIGDASTFAAKDFTLAGSVDPGGRFLERAVSKVWAVLRLLASKLMEFGRPDELSKVKQINIF